MLHESCIRECYELARRAVAAGNHPFGALLVHGGRIVLRAQNTVDTDRDCTRHAELNLVSAACRTLEPAALHDATLYTSTEPCAMCAGAIYWARIPRIVFGVSVAGLASVTDGSLAVPCREILRRARRPVEITGPMLEPEGLRIHREFWQTRRRQHGADNEGTDAGARSR